MEKSKPLEDLAVVIEGLPAELNILGGFRTEDGREWLVLTDIPLLEIGKDEYEIFQLFRNNGKVSIQSVDTTGNNYENLEMYNELVALWEKAVEDSET